MATKNDPTGKRFGKLTALRVAKRRDKRGDILWLCKCDCGKIIRANKNRLMSGSKKSCSHPGCYASAKRDTGNMYFNARMSFGITQSEMEQKTGFPRTYISRLERGDRHLTQRHAINRWNAAVPKEFWIEKLFKENKRGDNDGVVILLCECCGKLFESVVPSRKVRYCSWACSGKANGIKKRTRRYFVCGCGKPFSRTPSQIKSSLFCSRGCFLGSAKKNGFKNPSLPLEIKESEVEAAWEAYHDIPDMKKVTEVMAIREIVHLNKSKSQ